MRHLRAFPPFLLVLLAGCVAYADVPETSIGGSGGGGGASNVVGTLAEVEAETCTEGQMGYPSDSLYVLVCRSAGTWSYTIPGITGDLTKPPSTGWTAYNSGSVATSGGIRWLTLPDEAFAGNGWRGETRAEPSDPSVTPYYVEWVIIGTDYGFIGPGFSDATALQIAASRQTNRDLQIVRYPTAAGTGTIDITYVMSIERVLRIRLEHTGTNREFFLHSPDGTWNRIESGADGVTFTSDSVGWWGAMVTTGTAGKAGLVSFKTGAL